MKIDINYSSGIRFRNCEVKCSIIEAKEIINTFRVNKLKRILG